jgi:hypothetical protein
MQPDAHLWPKKSPAKQKKKHGATKRLPEESFITVPGGEGWENVHKEVKITPNLWVDDLPAQLWGLSKAGVTGNVLKKDEIVYNILTVPLYYAMLRPLLEHGSQVRVQYMAGKWKKRQVVETNLARIEKLCNFQNFNKTTGFLNSRQSSKKTTTFYNVIVSISATHTHRFATASKLEKQSAVFKVTVASLNPLATTVFPPVFERTVENLEVFSRYLQSFPVRLHREGYDVSAELQGICKELSKKRKRQKSAAAASSSNDDQQ